MKYPIYITSNNTYLRKSKEYLIVGKNNEKIPCPSESITYIVKYGNSQISEQLLNFLSDKGIIVFRYSYGGKFNGIFLPPENNIAKIRLKQYAAYFDIDKRLFLARQFIIAATKNKIKVLKLYQSRKKLDLDNNIVKIRSILKKLVKAENIESIRGYEGIIAREYFNGLKSCFKYYEFTGREYQPPKDEINALLSFAYSLLYSEIYCKINEHGLSVFCGYLHEQNNNQRPLVYDISEVFKQKIDLFILSMVNNNECKDYYFNKKPDKSCLLSTRGKQEFLKKWNDYLKKTIKLDEIDISKYELIRKEVIKLKNYLEGDDESYEGYLL